ncbi:MAG TPA: ABC transporter substrate-binding protein, partial [Stellaceae bacterium]|nr:ABC transporter substrate-binding protein [Stellaceae bacterium]
MRRALPYLLCFLLATSGVPGIARSAERVDELSIGVSQFPATLNPLIDTMVAKTYVLALVRRPLTTYDADWNLVCLLCETLPSFENGLARKTDLPGGKHGVRLTFAIRPNARWGDGVPVTSEDVIFTWQVGRNPQSGVAEGELYRRILKIEAKDAKTFTVELDRLTYDYADFSGLDILPAHIEREAFSDPTQYRFRTRFDTDPTNPGLYDGPYRITEVSPGSHIVFERNPSWWGDPPFFRRIVVWTVENTAALEANLLAG